MGHAVTLSVFTQSTDLGDGKFSPAKNFGIMNLKPPLKTILGCGVMTTLAAIATPSAIAQPVPPHAQEACITRTAEEMVVPTREISIVGAGPVDPENGVRTLSMRNVRTGQTADCRVNTIDGHILSVQLTGGGRPQPEQPPSGSVPVEGTFLGQGRVSGSVFGSSQAVETTLNFNQSDRFSLSLAVPPGTGAQVMYQGVIQQRRSTGPNSFLLQTSVQSVASSANGLRVVDTGGNCQIEVFDARMISSDCQVNVPNHNTRFTGMAQF